MSVAPVPTIVVLVAALIAAATDIWKFKVYNALTLPLMAGGLLYHGLARTEIGLAGSVLGLVFGFAVLLAFYAMGGMGAGDVKLMAAIGAWLGLPLTFYVFLASAFAGGIYAVALMALSHGVRETMINLQIMWLRVSAFGRHLGSEARVEAEAKRDDRRRRLIPFAAMVAAGVIATYIWLRVGPSR